MRLSTAGMHRSSIDAILEQQSKLSKTQNQVATGKKFQTASEDPIGAARAAGLDRKLADNAQYGRNSNIIQSRLSYEEQTLADITSVLQSARDSALAGANATLGQSERKMIANQVRQNLAALMDMANRQDGNGEYLFAGTSTATVPFAQGAGGVTYQGDQTTRQIRISSTQSLADVHAGVDAFMGIAERNGVFRTTVSAANTGNATISVGTVTNPAAWVPDNYTLQFTSATDWQVVDDTHADARDDSVGHGIHLGAEHQLPGRERGYYRGAGRERFVQRRARAAHGRFRHARRAGAHPRGRQRHRR